MIIHIVNQPTFIIDTKTYEPITSESNSTGETKFMQVSALYVGTATDEEITDILYEMAKKKGSENIYFYEVKENNGTIRCSFL